MIRIHRISLKVIYSIQIFQNKNVLSISTIEHIGLMQYNQTSKLNSVDAFKKISNESSSCLLSFPLGYNDLLDKFLFNEYGKTINPCNVVVYNRINRNTFKQVNYSKIVYKFGKV